MFKRTLILALLLSVAGHAAADAKLVMKDTEDGEIESVTYIRNGMVKLVSGDPAEESEYFLFDTKAGVMTQVNTEKRKYFVMDSAYAKAMRAQMDMQRKEFEAQMKNMPPEQRAMMEAMMKGFTDFAEQLKNSKITDTGRKAKHAGFNCRELEWTIDGKKQGEFCVADAGTVGLSGDDAATLHKAYKMMGKLAAEAGMNIGPLAVLERFDGVTVYSRTWIASEMVEELAPVKAISMEAEQFEIPATFTRGTAEEALADDEDEDEYYDDEYSDEDY